MRLLSQDRDPPAALADHALAVPHQHPRHRPKLGDELPPAREQILRARDGSSRALNQRAYPVTITSTGSRDANLVWPNPTGTSMSGNHRSHWATSQPPTPSATPDPVADRPGAAQPPGPAALGSTAASRSAQRSPWPASSATPPATPGSAARPHPRPTPAPAADTAAAHQQPAPASPCSWRPHHPGDLLDRHPLGPTQPADLRPVLHTQHPASSPARLQPGSRKGSAFTCR
jgi:hypothetical protein